MLKLYFFCRYFVLRLYFISYSNILLHRMSTSGTVNQLRLYCIT
jgi:hypothetical protein